MKLIGADLINSFCGDELESIVDALLLCIISYSFLPAVKAYNTKTATIVKHTEADDLNSNGFWKKQTSWKPRWVKYWQTKVVYAPLWKKVWGPVIQDEWVPLPSTPLKYQESSDPDFDSDSREVR